MLRIVLFLATNLAILVLLGIVMSVFGIDSRSTNGLLMIALVFGMNGSFISLALSKWIAKKSTGAQVIINPTNPTEQWLFETVERMAKDAEIGMPEVAIYDSSDMNAFATGMKKMISALQRLQAQHQPSQLPEQVAAFGIGPSKGRMAGLFRSHPPLEDRIFALQNL